MADATPRELEPATSNSLVRRLRDADAQEQLMQAEPAGPLGWPHVIVGRARDRPLARFVVGASGLILGASTGMFVGGMLGVILAMALLPLVPDIAVGLLVVTTVTCGSAGAVVGTRVLARETFDEVY